MRVFIKRLRLNRFEKKHQTIKVMVPHTESNRGPINYKTSNLKLFLFITVDITNFYICFKLTKYK